MTRGRPGAPPIARRGLTSLLVLTFTLLVTIIGATSIFATRVRFRAALDAGDVAKARYHARGMVEIALARLAADMDWRTTYAHDAWTPAERVGGVTYRFKLTDDADGDLQNDARQPVRLHGRALVGDTAREASVALRPDAAGVPNRLPGGDLRPVPGSWR